MKRSCCSEQFYIMSYAGHRNQKFDDPWKAVEFLRNMPKYKQQMYGITCEETYNYYNEDGSFHHREVYENWIDVKDYWEVKENDI